MLVNTDKAFPYRFIRVTKRIYPQYCVINMQPGSVRLVELYMTRRLGPEVQFCVIDIYLKFDNLNLLLI